MLPKENKMKKYERFLWILSIFAFFIFMFEFIILFNVPYGEAIRCNNTMLLAYAAIMSFTALISCLSGLFSLILQNIF